MVLLTTLFHELIKKSATKLTEDLYIDKKKAEFQLRLTTHEESNKIYDSFKGTIIKFNGNAELFHLNFYNIVVLAADDLFPNLCHNSNLVLGFEQTNLALAHLSS